jgi:chaperone required for assembly of F1-ATPase
MRDIFEEIVEGSVSDPTETAKRAMRPRLHRRFYQDVGLGESGEGTGILLDGRLVKTPARRSLAAPNRALADAIAAEWRAQAEVVDPAKMPLTRLASSIIDGVADAPAAVAADIARYLASDLVLYRADAPQGLVAAQAQAWDPVLDWAQEALGAHFVLGQGIVHVAQPEAALAAARAAIPRDAWRLGALHVVTTLTGSALIALQLLAGDVSAESAWAAAHVDEDWNMQTWGRDEPTFAHRAARFSELQAAATVLRLLG